MGERNECTVLCSGTALRGFGWRFSMGANTSVFTVCITFITHDNEVESFIDKHSMTFRSPRCSIKGLSSFCRYFNISYFSSAFYLKYQRFSWKEKMKYSRVLVERSVEMLWHHHLNLSLPQLKNFHGDPVQSKCFIFQQNLSPQKKYNTLIKRTLPLHPI